MLAFLLACSDTPAPAGPPTEAAIRSADALSAQVSPNGKAVIWPLSEGRNAFVGRLELEGGAQVPPHRDETDEVIVVLSGSGRLVLDGEEHAVGPGDAITMPAGAEVSYRNDAEPMVALQVFAGPAPAAKYESWTPLGEGGGPPTIGRVGPFVITCSSPECTLWHQGKAIGEPVWHYGDPERLLRPLGGGIVSTAGDAWLVSKHAGDGCPVIYEALCLVDGVPKRSDPFGNCEEPIAIEGGGRGAVFRFARSGEPGEIGFREAQVAAVDAISCTLGTDAPP